MGVIVKYRLAKRWAKNGVVTITNWIKRKWSKLCRKRLCNPVAFTRNQLGFIYGRLDKPTTMAKLVGGEKKKLTPFLKCQVQIICQEITKNLSRG